MNKLSLNFFSKKLTVAFFCTVMFLVSLNIFTPLRLITDGIRYLNIVEYLHGTLDKNSDAAHDYLPHGYPWLLFMLDKLNLLGSISITIINILSVLISSYILTRIFAIENKLFFFALVMSSFVNVKHFTLSISDQLFALLFMASIYLWSEFFNRRRYYIVPALLLTAASIYVRTAGIVLIPGIAFYMIYRNKAKLMERRALAGSVGFMLFAVAAIFIIKLPLLETKIDYLKQLNLMAMVKNPFSVVERLLMHFKEVGELTLNIPYSKLTGLIKIKNFDTAQYLLTIIGAITLFIPIKAIIRLKLFNHYAFWAFLTYLVIIFLWPFYDTRFLIPLIPVFIYLFTYSLFHFIEVRYIKIIPFFIYSFLGFAALIYSDAISLDKTFFVKHYGFDQQLTNKYKVHFKNKNNDKSNIPVHNITDDDVLFLLEKYDR